MPDTPDLFTPIQLGALSLPNRIVMAPMTRNRASEGNVPNELMVEYYRQRASAGLLITEGAQIMPEGQGYPLTPGIHSQQQIAGWRQVTDAVHQAGGRIVLQLWHVGRISHSSLQPQGQLPVAPSAVRPAGQAVTFSGMQPFETPRALEAGELPAIVAQYATAARNAREAGFDGIEIHSANGYLLDQFLRNGSNHRTDAYGGSIENRSRLLLEVVEAVCNAWSADHVGVRLSPVQPFNDMRDSDPRSTFLHVVKALNRFELAFLHITEMGKDNPGAAGPDFDFRLLRDAWDGIYMTNAGYDKTRANAAIASGAADLIAFGVPFIANPDLVERFRRNGPLNQADSATFYGGGAAGYTDYPTLARS